MSNIIDRMLGRPQKGSSSTAKERLQIVLVHDRINLPPERLKAMKEEILAVISKYVPVERESVDISLEQRDRTRSKIRAEIPFSATLRIIDPDEDVSDSVTARDLVQAVEEAAAAALAKPAEAPKAPDESEATAPTKAVDAEAEADKAKPSEPPKEG